MSLFYTYNIRSIGFLIFSHLFYFSNWRQNCDEWQPIVTFTQLRQNPLYITYYTTLTRLLLLGIFPLSLLMFFNYRIHYELQIPSIIEALPEIERIARRHQEKELAKVLIGIVSLFIICHTLRVLTDFYEMVNITNIIYCNKAGRNGISSWIIRLNIFSKLMLATNASLSMVVYCLINKTFRKKLLVMRERKTVNQQKAHTKIEERAVIRKTYDVCQSV